MPGSNGCATLPPGVFATRLTMAWGSGRACLAWDYDRLRLIDGWMDAYIDACGLMDRWIDGHPHLHTGLNAAFLCRMIRR